MPKHSVTIGLAAHQDGRESRSGEIALGLVVGEDDRVIGEGREVRRVGDPLVVRLDARNETSRPGESSRSPSNLRADSEGIDADEMYNEM